MKIVAVVGHHAEADEAVVQFGEWLATQRVHLLTGGGGGVMTAVAEGFTKTPRPAGHGLCIGVIPGDKSGHAKKGYPNPFVEIVIRTHLHGKSEDDGTGDDAPMGIYSRNYINALTADLMVAFPGGTGTHAEVTLAREFGKPVLALVPHGTKIGVHKASALRGQSIVVVRTLDELQSEFTLQLQRLPA